MGMGQNPMKFQCDWGNDHPLTRCFRVGCQGFDSWPYELWVFIDVVRAPNVWQCTMDILRTSLLEILGIYCGSLGLDIRIADGDGDVLEI